MQDLDLRPGNDRIHQRPLNGEQNPKSPANQVEVSTQINRSSFEFVWKRRCRHEKEQGGADEHSHDHRKSQTCRSTFCAIPSPPLGNDALEGQRRRQQRCYVPAHAGGRVQEAMNTDRQVRDRQPQNDGGEYSKYSNGPIRRP